LKIPKSNEKSKIEGQTIQRPKNTNNDIMKCTDSDWLELGVTSDEEEFVAAIMCLLDKTCLCP
jgi:exopolysaccharide biosynthesis protein